MKYGFDMHRFMVVLLGLFANAANSEKTVEFVSFSVVARGPMGVNPGLFLGEPTICWALLKAKPSGWKGPKT